MDKYFKGKTVFKHSSKPTGSRLEGKQSTLPVVDPKKRDTSISRQTITFSMFRWTSDACWWSLVVTRIWKISTRSSQESICSTTSTFGSNHWSTLCSWQLDLASYFWIPIHYVQRDIGGLVQKTKNFRDLVMNILPWLWIQKPKKFWSTPPKIGDFLVTFYFAQLLEQLSFQRKIWEIQPEGEFDFAARKPKRLPVPTGPTENEILERNFDLLTSSFMVSSLCPAEIKTKP